MTIALTFKDDVKSADNRCTQQSAGICNLNTMHRNRELLAIDTRASTCGMQSARRLSDHLVRRLSRAASCLRSCPLPLSCAGLWRWSAGTLQMLSDDQI